MRYQILLATIVLVLGFVAASVGAEELEFGGRKWQTTGKEAIDGDKAPDGVEGGSLRIPPGGRAVLKLRDENGSGKVEFLVYESGAAIADPKSRAAGPLYGVVQADGRMLAVGSIYAPFLSGDKTYSVTGYSPAAKEQPARTVQFLGINRTEGWHRWTFVFDAEKGISILHNGRNVNHQRPRFDAGKFQLQGFTGIVLMGDQSKDANQTIWVSSVTSELGGPMKAAAAPQAEAPETPAMPPALVPEVDPKPEQPVQLVEAVRGKHPRLLFSADDIPAMKAFIETPRGKRIWAELLSYLPSSKAPNEPTFLRNATDGQREGFWRLPTVALHYVLTGDQTSFNRTVEFMKFLMAQEHWELTELDSGMSAGNVMIGAALAYDWLYNDLDPEFREQYRNKLLLQARRMYYLGHMRRAPGTTHYWQNDPQNNHRWHRNAGLALCALAAADESKADDQWILERIREDLKFVTNWLPDDGTSHESPGYMIFGAAHLLLGITAADRCLGTDNLQQPFYKNLNRFMTQSLTPGLTNRFAYGDQGSVGVGVLNYAVFQLKTIAEHKLADHLAVLDQMIDKHGASSTKAWLAIVWYPKQLEAGRIENIPTHDFFSDLGLLFVRESWAEGKPAAMFKCSPLGGYELNLFRATNNMSYVNVAHDDPDANSFVLFRDGEFLAETSRYSRQKRSANHNTILINGLGQSARGRPDTGHWTQPAVGRHAMHDMGVVTAKAVRERNIAIEGEAAGSYPSQTRGATRPDLDRFRRAFIWVEGKYVLVLDDIRAPREVEVTWLMQGPQLETADADSLRFVLRSGEAQCPFQVVATAPMAFEVGDSPADHRGNALGWKQLRLKADTSAIRLASVYDLWQSGNLTVTLTSDGSDKATVNVKGRGIDDTWSWVAGEGRFGPSNISGKTAAGNVIIVMDKPEAETMELFEAVEKAVKASAE